jgi:ABC-type lipopolysaccharide export system ATPase subunit
MTSVIRCEGLTKRYRGVTALDGLDLEVGPGQVFGFLGPNGGHRRVSHATALPGWPRQEEMRPAPGALLIVEA